MSIFKDGNIANTPNCVNCLFAATVCSGTTSMQGKRKTSTDFLRHVAFISARVYQYRVFFLKYSSFVSIYSINLSKSFLL